MIGFPARLPAHLPARLGAALGFVVASLAWLPSADAAVGYVRSTDGAPWGANTNEQAMDLAFGPAAWDDLRYETVDAAVLLDRKSVV